jgi:hypothetical protein
LSSKFKGPVRKQAVAAEQDGKVGKYFLSFFSFFSLDSFLETRFAPCDTADTCAPKP